MSGERKKVGYTCAYAPMPLIDAAGFVPYRILPLGDMPDQAGSLLHDNICPHVKRVLDRALDEDLPDLAGLVVMSSCDAMRRLADGWRTARPDIPVWQVDLPSTGGEGAQTYLASRLFRLAETLSEWSGRPITTEEITASVDSYNKLTSVVDSLREQAVKGRLKGGWRALQEVRNLSVTEPTEVATREARRQMQDPAATAKDDGKVPLFIFGNVLPDPDVFDLFSECGGRIVGDDMCTGSRQLTTFELRPDEPVFQGLARNLLDRPACARTLVPGDRDHLARAVVDAVRACGARGAIMHTMKFCDPYLNRLPTIREYLEGEGVPLLVLEGDCTTRSLGQQSTRIEAFVEMLQEPEP